MPNDQDRLAPLERQLRNTRRLLAALVGVVLLACTVAAGPALVALVTKGVEVKNPAGKTVIELKDDGAVTVGGTLSATDVRANGKSVLAELQSLKNELDRVRKRNQEVETALRNCAEGGLFGTPKVGLELNTEYVAESDGIVVGGVAGVGADKNFVWSVQVLVSGKKPTGQGLDLTDRVAISSARGWDVRDRHGPAKQGGSLDGRRRRWRRQASERWRQSGGARHLLPHQDDEAAEG
jgi:hypothetical protein